MKNEGLYIPKELLQKANFESNNLTAVIENGVIRIVEEDEAYCCGYFTVDEETGEKETEEKEVQQKQTQSKTERQLLSKKGSIYLSVALRNDLDFEVGNVLELIIEGENLVIRKLDL